MRRHRAARARYDPDLGHGRIAVERYWQPPMEQREVGPEESTERLDALLRGAVRRQIVADVPVGVFLSFCPEELIPV